MISIGNYVYVGIEEVLFENLTTGLVDASLPLVVDLNLEKTADENWVEGGLGLQPVIQLVGAEKTKLTMSTATLTKEFLELKTGTKIKTLASTYEKVSEELTVSGGKFTLSKTLAPNAKVTVKAYQGKILSSSLEAVTATSPTAGQYKIAGQEITCDASVTKIWVAYTAVATNREALEMNQALLNNYCVTGKLVGKTEDGKVVYHQIEIPNGAISVNWNITSKNGSDVPDAVEIVVNALKDGSKGYVSRILF